MRVSRKEAQRTPNLRRGLIFFFVPFAPFWGYSISPLVAAKLR